MSDEQAAPETKGVAVEALGTVDLAGEIDGLDGSQLRMRMVTIEPGGVFGPVHDHQGRPGIVYVLQGTITDHRDGGTTDYGPGIGLARGPEHDPLAREPGDDPGRGDLGRHRRRSEWRHRAGWDGACVERSQDRRALLEPVLGLAAAARRPGSGPTSSDTTRLWTWDHLYPIVGASDGPNYEGWLTITAWAQATHNVRIGLMVGANTFRAPTLTAKLATTLDHISGGRAILGIGGAWFEEEHEAFGLEFGSGFPERLRWLGEALPVMRGMLDGTEPTAKGDHYHAKATRNLPGAGPGAPADLHRRRRGEGHAQAGREVRRHEQRRRRRPSRCATRSRCCSSTATRSAATRPRSSGRSGSGPSSSATTGPRPSASSTRRSIATASPSHWVDQPVGTPEDVAEKLSPLRRARLPAPDLRLPGELRRGVDDPVRDRGPAAARERLAGGPASSSPASAVRCFDR